MKLKTILASLILGSAAVSSVAMASPSVTITAKVPTVSLHASYGTTVVRDHRPVTYAAYDNDRWGRRPSYRPVMLGSSLQFAGDGRTFLDVGAQLGRFDRLQISGAGGRTFIKQVYVEFDNGQEQSIRNINRTLSGGEALTLDLDGNRRGIRRIVVYGNASGGWRRAAGTFTVSAL